MSQQNSIVHDTRHCVLKPIRVDVHQSNDNKTKTAAYKAELRATQQNNLYERFLFISNLMLTIQIKIINTVIS